ncbi:hypothetical protein, partial [Flavobacterium sp.]|uniref:hypothetical protein n=1 Tax=Flavobacterium sp. TaxID=239 RepID=UPI0037538D8B
EVSVHMNYYFLLIEKLTVVKRFFSFQFWFNLLSWKLELGLGIFTRYQKIRTDFTNIDKYYFKNSDNREDYNQQCLVLK